MRAFAAPFPFPPRQGPDFLPKVSWLFYRSRRGSAKWAAFLAAAFLILYPPESPGSAPKEDWFRPVGPRAWLGNYDPTLIGRRLYSETSYESDRNGDYTLKMANSVRDAFSPTDNLALGAQFELPIKWARNKGVVANGVSAFEWRAGGVLRLTDHLRWGTALNVKVPTSVDAQLGSPWTELRPICAFSWDIRDWLNLGWFTSYYFTPANTSPSGTNKIELEWPLAAQITESLSLIVNYKPTFYPGLEEATHTLKFGTTLLFGPAREFSVFPAFEIPLGPYNSKSDLEWKAYLALSWTF
jgi:hypothetical protein